MKRMDEHYRQKALLTMMQKLNEARTSVKKEGTVSSDELTKEIEEYVTES